MVDPASASRRSLRVAAGPVLAAWLLALGFDLFLHAGLLADLYQRGSPFLLEPAEAFRRIPLGYAAFLAMTAMLYALFVRLDVRGARNGLRLGLMLGVVLWGVFLFGLYSIATIEVDLLLGWWLGQSVELGLVGAVIGSACAGTSTRRLLRLIVPAVLAMFVLVVVLQSTGVVPATRIDR